MVTFQGTKFSLNRKVMSHEYMAMLGKIIFSCTKVLLDNVSHKSFCEKF
jgi:hypothetical protein